jgi:hypothetical protein
MELLLGFFALLCTYIVAVYFVTRFTLDHCGARSGLFGAGIVTMFMGFILHSIIAPAADGILSDDSGFVVLYLIFYYGFLIMGLSGIVMIAVDLLKGINEMSSFASRTFERKDAGQNYTKGRMPAGQKENDRTEKSAPAPQGHIPAWKRIQMEQEGK